MAIIVAPLERTHRPLLKTFCNQHDSLTEYLQRFALRHMEKDFLTKTYLAIDSHQGKQLIAGYFSLTTVSVDRASLKPSAVLDKLPRFPIPGVLLARLAVDQRVQGQGLGRFLFEEALGRTIQLARNGPITFRLLVTDAIDESAVTFYQRFSLLRLADQFPCRMVLDLAPMLTS